MTASRTASRLALLMLLIAAIWYAALITLAVRTANPPTLNARQVIASNIVVVGTVDADGTVRVTKSYLGIEPKGPIKLIADNPLPAGELILPLLRDGPLFRVTPTGLPGRSDRLVYPAQPETLAQLEAILK